MNSYTIKAKRQDNGIYGMPMSVKSYSGAVLEFKNVLLRSAIIVALSETYPTETMKIRVMEDGIWVWFSGGRFVVCSYKNYLYESGKLIWKDGKAQEKR